MSAATHAKRPATSRRAPPAIAPAAPPGAALDSGDIPLPPFEDFRPRR